MAFRLQQRRETIYSYRLGREGKSQLIAVALSPLREVIAPRAGAVWAKPWLMAPAVRLRFGGQRQSVAIGQIAEQSTQTTENQGLFFFQNFTPEGAFSTKLRGRYIREQKHWVSVLRTSSHFSTGHRNCGRIKQQHTSVGLCAHKRRSWLIRKGARVVACMRLYTMLALFFRPRSASTQAPLFCLPSINAVVLT